MANRRHPSAAREVCDDNGIRPERGERRAMPEDLSNRRRPSVARELAEREGFEPSVEFPLHTLSKRAPSTTRTSLRAFGIIHLREAELDEKANCDPTLLARSRTCGTRAACDPRFP